MRKKRLKDVDFKTLIQLMKLLKQIAHFLKKDTADSVGCARQSAVIDVARRAAIAICHDDGLVMRCRGGSLWITQLGNPNDIVMIAGQDRIVSGCQDIVIQAFCTATIEIEICGPKSGRMTVNFVEAYFRLPNFSSRPRLSIEGQFWLSTTEQGVNIFDIHSRKRNPELALVR